MKNTGCTRSKYEIICIQCGSTALIWKYSKSAGKYCSHACQKAHEYKVFISKWIDGEVSGTVGKKGISKHVRRYMFEKYNSKCCLCGWGESHPLDGRIPLEVDHIDGDWKNTTEANLRLICPNCHSLTHTYKSRNRGKSSRTYKPA